MAHMGTAVHMQHLLVLGHGAHGNCVPTQSMPALGHGRHGSKHAHDHVAALGHGRKGTDVCTLLSGSAGTQQGCKQVCPHFHVVAPCKWHMREQANLGCHILTYICMYVSWQAKAAMSWLWDMAGV